jgi:hypothetical protein
MKNTRNLLIASSIALASIAPAQAGPRKGQGLAVVGLTSDQRLITFREHAPQGAKNLSPVSGLIDGDTVLVGIDYRVQDGNLYGVGNAGGVYTIDPQSGVATFVNRLTIALSGTSFGVDFNPAADRLRIISDNGQNLRHNVNAGGVTLLDGALNYTPGNPAAGVTGAAYTNNDLDATTATTLYNIDSSLDQVVLQSPPNAGSLATIGKLTLDTSPAVGFDIHSSIHDGVTIDNRALASLSSATGAASLYAINLTTGRVTWRGVFRNSDHVIDIAIPLGQ